MKKFRLLAIVLALACAITASTVVTAFADSVKTETVNHAGAVQATLTPNSFVRLAKKESDAAVKATADQYIAVGLRVVEITGTTDPYFPCHIGFNDANIPEDGQTVPTSLGTVENKWGNYFFIPASFDGIIYLKASRYNLVNVDLYAFSVAADAARTTKFCITKVFLCDDTTATSGASVLDFNFTTATDSNVINDARVTGTENGYTAERLPGESYTKVTGAYVAQDAVDMIEVGVKASGVAVTGYGYFDLALSEPFVLADGLSVNVESVTQETYFHISLVDENDVVWSPVYWGGDEASSIYKFPFYTAEEAKTFVPSVYGAFFMRSGALGTLYLDKSCFASTASEMGKIKAIRFGMDMQYGLGRGTALGKICNVSTTAATPVVDFAGVKEFDIASIALGEGNYVTNWMARVRTIEDKYRITATTSVGGTAAYTVDGRSVTFSAQAKADYVLTGATLNGEPITLTDGKYTVNEVTGNLAFAATFRALTLEEKFDFEATAGANGAVTYEVVDNTVVFTATPDEGYCVESATLNGTAVTLTDNKYTAQTVTENLAFAVTFRALTLEEKFDFVATAEENGTATYEVVGNTVVFTATPAEGYRVTLATVNGEEVTLDADGKYTATDVASDLTFVVTFEQIPAPAKSGCGSSAVAPVAFGALAMLAVAILLVAKKKERV